MILKKWKENKYFFFNTLFLKHSSNIILPVFAQNVKFIMVACALSLQAALAIILKGFEEVKHQSIIFSQST